ncbi:MAG: hypothetical protein ACYCYK_09865 [Candidatus Dormibacteria bacterium]
MATATKGGWTLSAASRAGQLWVEVAAPGGTFLPNYCGGPGFDVFYVNHDGVRVAAPPQPLAQYCRGGVAATQTFVFSVPRAPGLYTVRAVVPRSASEGGQGAVTIPPALVITVSSSGLAVSS